MTSHVTFGLGILSCHLNKFMIHTLLIGDMKIGTSGSKHSAFTLLLHSAVTLLTLMIAMLAVKCPVNYNC